MPRRMRNQEVRDQFRDSGFIAVVLRYEQDGVPDIPARREAWNNYVDMLHKDGMLTDHQAHTLDADVEDWPQPSWQEVEAYKREWGL